MDAGKQKVDITENEDSQQKAGEAYLFQEFFFLCVLVRRTGAARKMPRFRGI